MSDAFALSLLPAAQAHEHTAELGALLHACVQDGASVGFVLPYSVAQAQAYWRDTVIPELRGQSLMLLIARRGGAIAGTVQLDCAGMPNQHHRAEVRKLLVHPTHRRLGVARALMVELESLARQAGRTLLTLDTRSGDVAQQLYGSLGYQVAGEIPGYARDPYGSPAYHATTFMYKRL